MQSGTLLTGNTERDPWQHSQQPGTWITHLGQERCLCPKSGRARACTSASLQGMCWSPGYQADPRSVYQSSFAKKFHPGAK